MFDNQQIMHLNLHNGQILRKIDLCNGQYHLRWGTICTPVEMRAALNTHEPVTFCHRLLQKSFAYLQKFL